MRQLRDYQAGAIIFLTDYTTFGQNINSYSINVYGKTVLGWTVSTLADINYVTLPIDSRTDLLREIKHCAPQGKYTICLFSDTPLLRPQTLLGALKYIDEQGLDVCALPRGYIVRNQSLTDIVSLDNYNKINIGDEDFFVADGYPSLAYINQVIRSRIIDFHLSNGVHIIDPLTTHIDAETIIGQDVVIHPNNIIRGKSVIYSQAELYPNNVITNSVIGSKVTVKSSTLEDAKVGDNSQIGPNANLRAGSEIGNGCRIGNFVEIKKSTIGENTKIAHLTYVGDAVIGKNVNIGCGVVFANYDGVNKHKTVVKDNVFIGSNCSLVAPLVLENGCKIAAGTTVTQNVSENSLCIGRVRQTEKKGYYKTED